MTQLTLSPSPSVQVRLKEPALSCGNTWASLPTRYS